MLFGIDGLLRKLPVGDFDGQLRRVLLINTNRPRSTRKQIERFSQAIITDDGKRALGQLCRAVHEGIATIRQDWGGTPVTSIVHVPPCVPCQEAGSNMSLQPL